MSHELDGTYRINTTDSYTGPLKQRSDGETIIENGQTERLDENKCKWTSTFEIISENEVKMTSVADPSACDIDFLITGADGNPTRDPVTYETILRLSRRGDNEIQMSGQIEYANEVVILTMRKIVD